MTAARFCLGLALAAATGDVFGWADTATRVPALAGAQLLGAAPADMPMQVAVALKLRNEATLDALIASVTTPGSPAFGGRFDAAQLAPHLPTEAQARGVADYLRHRGFVGVVVAANRMLVSAVGTVATVDLTFRTVVNRYRYAGQVFYANALPAQVPDEIGDSVNAILGLQSAATVRATAPSARLAQDRPERVRQLVAPAFQRAYHARSTPSAANTVGAIITFNDMSLVLEDLRLAERMNNQPPLPVDIKVIGGTVMPATTSNSEFTMDTQAARGIAGTFQKMIWYTDANLATDYVGGLPIPAAAINAWVSDNLAPTASMSLVECEALAIADGTMAAIDASLKLAVAQGQTLFVGSGDSGAYCGTVAGAGGAPLVNYPSSSPYAVAVGGTTLSTFPNSSYAGELGWTLSGGGFSVIEPAPRWQARVAEPLTGGKSLPDIAMASAPGMVFTTNAEIDYEGGTSLAGPLAMGAWARIQSAAGNQLGFAAPYFYALLAQAQNSGDWSPAATGFHDVVGNDDASPAALVRYHATLGYDRMTGIGSVDICRLANLLAPPGHPDFCAAPPGKPIGFGTTVAASTTTAEVCAPPGMTLVGLHSASIDSLSVVEPPGDPRRIAFIVALTPQAKIDASTLVRVVFESPDGQLRFVQMDTPAGASAAEFVHGTVDDLRDGPYRVEGALEAQSGYSAEHRTLTLVADEGAIGARPRRTNLAHLFVQLPLSADSPDSATGQAEKTKLSWYTLRPAYLCRDK